MKAQEYLNKEYGPGHISVVVDQNDYESLYGLMDEFANARLDVAINQMKSQQSFLSKDNAKVARQAMSWCLDIVEQLKTKNQ